MAHVHIMWYSHVVHMCVFCPPPPRVLMGSHDRSKCAARELGNGVFLQCWGLRVLPHFACCGLASLVGGPAIRGDLYFPSGLRCAAPLMRTGVSKIASRLWAQDFRAPSYRFGAKTSPLQPNTTFGFTPAHARTHSHMHMYTPCIGTHMCVTFGHTIAH